MRTPRIAAASLLAITALAGIAAGEAVDPAAVDISGLEATATDGSLAVSGDLAFGGAFSAGEDNADPNGQGKLPGTNMTHATVNQRGFFVDFHLAIANMVPADPYAVGEALQYGWDLYDGNGAAVSLAGWRSAVAQTASTDGYFAVNSCAPDPDTGQSTCTPTPAEGAFTADGVTWTVPVTSLGGTGSTISLAGEGPAHVTAGASGTIWFNPGSPIDLENFLTFGEFTLGGSVAITISDANGSPVTATSAKILAPGAFTKSIDVSGLPAGTYTVTATSKYADLVDTEVTTFTIE